MQVRLNAHSLRRNCARLEVGPSAAIFVLEENAQSKGTDVTSEV